MVIKSCCSDKRLQELGTDYYRQNGSNSGGLPSGGESCCCWIGENVKYQSLTVVDDVSHRMDHTENTDEPSDHFMEVDVPVKR